jgi:hypothetical protein
MENAVLPRSRTRILAVASLCVALLGACDSGTEVVNVASVAVAPDTATIEVGASRKLSAAVGDAGGAALTGRTVNWTSSNAAVASVDGTGLVTARAPGSAAITATSEGKSGTATITVPVPKTSLSLVSVNGSPVARGQTAEPRDTLAVSVRVSVSPSLGAAGPFELVRQRPDMSLEPLAQIATMVAPGTTADITLLARNAPSGEYRVFVRANGVGTSDTTLVNLRRPTSAVRIVALNGQAAGGAAPLAIADSFRVTVAVTVADTAASRLLVALIGNRSGRASGDVLGGGDDEFSPGTTVHATYTAYTAPAGAYNVWLEAIRTAGLTTVGESPRVAVQVTQSDVTPPTLRVTAPLNGATVTTTQINIRATASDARGVWLMGYRLIGGCGSTSEQFNAGPYTTASLTYDRRVCGLNVGENRIVVQAQDIAFNTTVDTIVVNYRPTVAAGGDSSSGAAAETVWPRSTTVLTSRARLVRDTRTTP